MTTKLVKWASNDGQIIKSGLSDGYGGKAITTAAHLDYDRHGFEGYPGNVGFHEMRTQEGRVVFRMECMVMIDKRPRGATAV